ncbi:MAG: [protein-PII] uridylyltransferase [Alphaproteobacteria bacterium]|nr:[protein-PII] uridylyltransferase [Alphaproteobacteria bacterium]
MPEEALAARSAAGELLALDGLAPGDRRLRHRHQIIDPEALEERIDTLWTETGEPTAFRAGLLPVLRETLDAGRAEIRGRFMQDHNGANAVRAGAFLMDAIIRALHEAITTRMYRAPNPTSGEQICVIAIGGYGRGEIAPFSDIDLLFLLPYKATPYSEQVVEAILYLLWDLRLKVGHATRSIEECLRQARADMTIRTSVLEARYLCGERELMEALSGRFHAEVVSGSAVEFVEAKLQESDRRHQRLGDSRYVIEPNVKDGKGGLRDLHTLFWIGKYVYQVDEPRALVGTGMLSHAEARRFSKAQKQLWTIRCHLHYLTGRAEERLTVDLQREIADLLGYTDRSGARAVERFMKHYYLTAKDVGDLTRIFCAAVEAEHRRRPRFRLRRLWNRRRSWGDFRLDGDRLNVVDDDALARDPVNLVRMFHVAQENDLEFHPHCLRLATAHLRLIDRSLRDDPEANRLFLEIVTSRNNPERTLRRMNEAQVFGRFVPDFGRVVAQMQYDMYHVYTVDEHTIIMLGILHRIERGELAEIAPVATEVIHKVISRRELYVAVLLHDIAKGRNGDHSVLGEKVARRLCPRFGLGPDETETVAWLVRWHLLMSHAAFKRDVNDPQTISDFANIVQSPERLRLLLVLTVADIRAVGPNVWNGWKAALLRELYWRAEEMLSGEAGVAGPDARVRMVHDELRARLADWDDAAFAAHAERANTSYWLGRDVDTLERHARLIDAAEKDGGDLTIEFRVDSFREVTEVTVLTADHPGLFAHLTGGLAAAGANIVDARISTLRDGTVLDSFWVQDVGGKALDDPDSLRRLRVTVSNAVRGKLDIDKALAGHRASLPGRVRTMAVAQRVLIDNKASNTHTVIEVNGADRPGLLYRLTRSLARLNLQISSAKISTFGISIVDVFYVKDLFGLKVESDRQLEAIRRNIQAELNSLEPGGNARRTG